MQPRYNTDSKEGKSKVHPPGRLATAQPSKQSNPASLKQGGRLSSKSQHMAFLCDRAPMVTLGFPGSDQADLPLLERKPLDQPHTSASSGFLFFFKTFKLDLALIHLYVFERVQTSINQYHEAPLSLFLAQKWWSCFFLQSMVKLFFFIPYLNYFFSPW